MHHSYIEPHDIKAALEHVTKERGIQGQLDPAAVGRYAHDCSQRLQAPAAQRGHGRD